MTKAAWIGLGVMGAPMAGFLSQKPDVDLTVYNRTATKAETWLQKYQPNGNTLTSAPTPAEAASSCDFVFSCIGNDDDLREVTIGEHGAFNTMSEGTVFTDHSTTSATVAVEIAEKAAERGISFLDAPVTGGQKGAENGTLSIMVGGDKSALEKASPLIDTYSKAIRHIGKNGNGQKTKMVNQIAIAGVVQGLAEAVNFAKRADLDIDAVLAVITKGAAQSWQMENSGKSMYEGEFDFGFAIDLMKKDLGICIDEAERNGASLPFATQVENFFGDVQAMGGGRWDITSLIKRLED